MKPAEYPSVNHFSQANPSGPGQDDVPALLRRVADTVETLGPVDIHELVLHNELTADGDWNSITVHFAASSAAES